jgi:hypothetical protein
LGNWGTDGMILKWISEIGFEVPDWIQDRFYWIGFYEW